MGLLKVQEKKKKEEKKKIRGDQLAENWYENNVLSPGTRTPQKEMSTLIFHIPPCNEIFVCSPWTCICPEQ